MQSTENEKYRALILYLILYFLSYYIILYIIFFHGILIEKINIFLIDKFTD